MNLKKRNSRHLQDPIHFKYLMLFPLIFFIAGIFGGLAVIKARNDLKRIGLYVRGIRNPGVRPGITYHKVRNFDTIESIAEEYEISIDTLLWSNDLSPAGISEDMVIMIPPVTGVVHIVQNRETIEGIARMYQTDPKKIIDFPYNEFSEDVVFPITPGQVLFVPDGIKNW